jgi:hypothetical protein
VRSRSTPRSAGSFLPSAVFPSVSVRAVYIFLFYIVVWILIWPADEYVLLSPTNDAAGGDGKAVRSRMAREQLEESIVADGNGKEEEVGVMGIGAADGADDQHGGGKLSMKSLLWHGGSVWDAWFSCASNQVGLTHLTSSPHSWRSRSAPPP